MLPPRVGSLSGGSLGAGCGRGQVSTFLAKAERQIGSKVSNDELTRVTKAFAEQLQETRNVLQAQMDVVRGRAERSTEDFQQVVDKMDAIGSKSGTPSARVVIAASGVVV